MILQGQSSRACPINMQTRHLDFKTLTDGINITEESWTPIHKTVQEHTPLNMKKTYTTSI